MLQMQALQSKIPMQTVAAKKHMPTMHLHCTTCLHEQLQINQFLQISCATQANYYKLHLIACCRGGHYKGPYLQQLARCSCSCSCNKNWAKCRCMTYCNGLSAALFSQEHTPALHLQQNSRCNLSANKTTSTHRNININFGCHKNTYIKTKQTKKNTAYTKVCTLIINNFDDPRHSYIKTKKIKKNKNKQTKLHPQRGAH